MEDVNYSRNGKIIKTISFFIAIVMLRVAMKLGRRYCLIIIGALVAVIGLSIALLADALNANKPYDISFIGWLIVGIGLYWILLVVAAPLRISIDSLLLDPKKEGSNKEGSASEILDMRLGIGEITKEEYYELKSLMNNNEDQKRKDGGKSN